MLALICMLGFGYAMCAIAEGSDVSEAELPGTSSEDLNNFKWRHGLKDCSEGGEDPIQVFEQNPNTYVLRQSKCTHYEAPFLYLLIGTEKAVLVDTGAIAEAKIFPLYSRVSALLKKQAANTSSEVKELLVLHSHRHKDHYQGDVQFEGQARVQVIKPDAAALRNGLGFKDWPNTPVSLSLGERELTIFPIPGHQAESIALYDHQTKWLLTGDSLYPGSIRVRDWDQYKSSIERLSKYARAQPVSAILGGHIEMRADKNKIYRIGSTYQPLELPLALPVNDLHELHAQLSKTGKSQKLRFDRFIIAPLSFMERQMLKLMEKKSATVDSPNTGAGS